jgi:hypothetical protein
VDGEKVYGQVVIRDTEAVALRWIRGETKVKDDDFQRLVTSIEQAGQIKRGELEPARKFEVRTAAAKAIAMS